MNTLKLLAGTGALTICCIGALILVFIFDAILELVKELKGRYRVKHRFDKKPTAACYCVDCVKWNPDNGDCFDHCNSRRMADNWFCCFAVPKKDKEKKNEKKA